jgi:hypothetical protein
MCGADPLPPTARRIDMYRYRPEQGCAHCGTRSRKKRHGVETPQKLLTPSVDPSHYARLAAHGLAPVGFVRGDRKDER